jgi:hypothetical protein
VDSWRRVSLPVGIKTKGEAVEFGSGNVIQPERKRVVKARSRQNTLFLFG